MRSMQNHISQYINDGFFSGKKILITGHTGFKGSWLSILLSMLGAKVYGYSLEPPTNPSLFVETGLSSLMQSHIGDIRDYEHFSSVLKEVEPEIVIHMAAQPLVRESYLNPIDTYTTNVIGTVNILDAVRHSSGVKVVLVITTDKCYENKEWVWGYRENEALGGYDPYSSSKACSEIAVASFRSSFFNLLDYDKHGTVVATARAGNVIGGGDWATDRLIPDFFRSISKQEQLVIRSPLATRPWQHVLEPLTGYLMLVRKAFEHGPEYGQAWNFGPDDDDVQNVEWIARTICELWGDGASYTVDSSPKPHEARYLKLDCSKAKTELGWKPRWSISKTLATIVEWNKCWISGGDVLLECQRQIHDFLHESNCKD